MQLSIFNTLSRSAKAIYLADNREGEFAIAFLGLAKSVRQLEKLRDEAAKLVTEHRLRHPGNARTEATWLTGDNLDALWLGSISRQNYDLVEAKSGSGRWTRR